MKRAKLLLCCKMIIKDPPRYAQVSPPFHICLELYFIDSKRSLKEGLCVQLPSVSQSQSLHRHPSVLVQHQGLVFNVP